MVLGLRNTGAHRGGSARPGQAPAPCLLQSSGLIMGWGWVGFCPPSPNPTGQDYSASVGNRRRTKGASPGSHPAQGAAAWPWGSLLRPLQPRPQGGRGRTTHAIVTPWHLFIASPSCLCVCRAVPSPRVGCTSCVPHSLPGPHPPLTGTPDHRAGQQRCQGWGAHAAAG